MCLHACICLHVYTYMYMYMQDPTVSCTAGLIENFTISFNLSSLGGPVSIRRNDTYCNATAQQCSYTHPFPPDLSEPQFDVEVTASNVVGESPATTLTIGKYEANLSNVSGPQTTFWCMYMYVNVCSTTL